MRTYHIRFHGLTKTRSYPVPSHLNQLLEMAQTPEQIEMLLSEYEAELAQLDNECDDFLTCDSAAELMADVLSSKQIICQIICGKNDEGDSHSYVQVGEKKYDPTQGFGLANTSDAGTVGGEE